VTDAFSDPVIPQDDADEQPEVIRLAARGNAPGIERKACDQQHDLAAAKN
jgi:hypothetical protein